MYRKGGLVAEEVEAPYSGSSFGNIEVGGIGVSPKVHFAGDIFDGYIWVSDGVVYGMVNFGFESIEEKFVLSVAMVLRVGSMQLSMALVKHKKTPTIFLTYVCSFLVNASNIAIGSSSICYLTLYWIAQTCGGCCGLDGLEWRNRMSVSLM